MTDEIETSVEGHWHHRAIVRNGQEISRVEVPDHLIWLHGVQVRMGGIGGVHTAREHRMQGHSSRLLRDTVSYMTGLGQDVSMLWGISDYYDKFGFMPFMAEHSIHVATRDAERTAAGAQRYTCRPMACEDAGFVVGLYNDDNVRRPTALVRTVEHFGSFRKGSDYRTETLGCVFEDAEGRPIGYAAADDRKTEVKVTEVNAVEHAAFPCILDHFARTAVDRRCGHIEFHMPPDHAFARYCLRCGAGVHSTYPRMGNGMMRILNQESLFAKLLPALEKRLAASCLAGRRVALTLETDLGTARLDLHAAAADGEAEVCVALPQSKLTQLVVGYRLADDVLADPEVESTGPAEDVLGVLFPCQVPYVWLNDRF